MQREGEPGVEDCLEEVALVAKGDSRHSLSLLAASQEEGRAEGDPCM